MRFAAHYYVTVRRPSLRSCIALRVYTRSQQENTVTRAIGSIEALSINNLRPHRYFAVARIQSDIF